MPLRHVCVFACVLAYSGGWSDLWLVGFVHGWGFYLLFHHKTFARPPHGGICTLDCPNETILLLNDRFIDLKIGSESGRGLETRGWGYPHRTATALRVWLKLPPLRRENLRGQPRSPARALGTKSENAFCGRNERGKLRRPHRVGGRGPEAMGLAHACHARGTRNIRIHANLCQ